jgi:dihydropteroate synthase
MRAEVAAASVSAGAAIVNDVSGGLADPEMLAAVAQSGAGYITMHWRGHSFGMYDRARYVDVVAEVCDELVERAEAALAAGIPASRLAIDPGFGFAKNHAHNWTLLAGLERVEALGRPVLVGVSRKGFLGRPGGLDPEPRDRDAATAAVTTLVAERRVWAVRTHDVRSQAAAISVVERIRAQREVAP